MVKALIEAGASASMNCGTEPENYIKMERMIHQLSIQSEHFQIVERFFCFSSAIHNRDQAEVFKIYKEYFFEEHPVIHLIIFELYFGVTGPIADQYHQRAIKWLKDKRKADIYTEGVISRFPRIPQKHWLDPLNCLNVALCISKRISPQVFSDLVSILTNSFQHSGNAQGEKINHLILKILNVMMQKSSEQKLRLNHSVYEKLCNSLLPLTRPDYSILIRMWAYSFLPTFMTSLLKLLHYTDCLQSQR